MVTLTLRIMEKRLSRKRVEDQELTKKGSDKSDKMQERMGSRLILLFLKMCIGNFLRQTTMD